MANSSRQVHPQALPGYQEAVIRDDKIRDYALNPGHVWGKSRGSDKARVFKRALGFDRSNWEMLRDRILAELPFYEAVPTHEDEYGKRYTVILSIMGANGKRADVLTAWIVRPGTDHPSLITAFVD